MTLKELKDELNLLPPETDDLNVEFATDPFWKDGKLHWTDISIVGFMFHPDEGDFMFVDENVSNEMLKRTGS